MELPVEAVKIVIDLSPVFSRPAGAVLDTCHGLLGFLDGGIAPGLSTGSDRAEDGRPECAGLLRGRQAEGHAQHIGVDLQQESVFFGNSSADHNLIHSYPAGADLLDNRPGTEGCRLQEGPVDFPRRGPEGLAKEQAAEPGVGKDAAVAIVPVKGEQAGVARPELPGLARKIFVSQAGGGAEFPHEPGEDVAES